MKWSGNFWWLAFSLLLLIGCGSDQDSKPEYRSKEEIQIIPQPKELSIDKGFFMLNEETIIINGPKSKQTGKYLKDLIELSSNFEIDLFNNM
ncbi:MAG: hypothetical protein P8Q14_04665 [Vicingaceae bacterium]|nr:hypothetical protein [Vicingaceae bacterium]